MNRKLFLSYATLALPPMRLRMTSPLILSADFTDHRKSVACNRFPPLFYKLIIFLFFSLRYSIRSILGYLVNRVHSVRTLHRQNTVSRSFEQSYAPLDDGG